MVVVRASPTDHQSHLQKRSCEVRNCTGRISLNSECSVDGFSDSWWCGPLNGDWATIIKPSGNLDGTHTLRASTGAPSASCSLRSTSLAKSAEQNVSSIVAWELPLGGGGVGLYPA